jgi:hypothetical protein
MKRFPVLIGAVALIAFMVGCGGDNLTGSSSLSAPLAQLTKFVPADAVIDSVKLYVEAVDVGTQTVTAHQITKNWDESSVTWTSFGASFNTSPLSAASVSAAGQVEFDVTPAARSWFDSTAENFGLLLQQTGTEVFRTSFSSREGTGTAPSLKVCYTTFEGPACETFEVDADAYIYQDIPETNFGGAELLYVGRDGSIDSTYFTLLQFAFPVEIRYATIGDFVWNDENRNGLQDAGEPGLEGITVELFNCADELQEATVTDVNGAYEFGSLLAGDYYVKVTAPANFVISAADVGADDNVDSDVDPGTGASACLSLNPGVTDISVDIGLTPNPSSVGDFVWHDENENGIQDEGEMGIADIVVRLYACDGTLLDETTSDADGAYLFENLEAGDYYLEFVNPFGYIFTLQNVGDDALDSDVDRFQKRTECFSLGDGVEAFDWDAGLFAFEGCTRSKGYWKNHAGFGPQPDSVTWLLPTWLGTAGGNRSLAVDNAEMAVELLQQHEYGDPSNGITKLYAQLLAAKLNIVNFANPADIFDVISDADAFLADYNWEDWNTLGSEDRHQVLEWKDMLDEYNNGDIGPGSCDDNDEDDDMNGDNDDM